jgi:hypothetical protein
MTGMTAQVLHHPRLAWDGARVIVRTLESAQQPYGWLAEQLGDLLGPEYRQALFESWHRIWVTERPDAPQAEAGLWRVRLEDFLRFHPDRAMSLLAFLHEATARLTTPA